MTVNQGYLRAERKIQSALLSGKKVLDLRCNHGADEDMLRELPKSMDHPLGNRLTSLPATLLLITKLKVLALDSNPLEPGLAAAYANGIDAVKPYLKSIDSASER